MMEQRDKINNKKASTQLMLEIKKAAVGCCTCQRMYIDHVCVPTKHSTSLYKFAFVYVVAGKRVHSCKITCICVVAGSIF